MFCLRLGFLGLLLRRCVSNLSTTYLKKKKSFGEKNSKWFIIDDKLEGETRRRDVEGGDVERPGPTPNQNVLGMWDDDEVGGESL